MTTVSLTQPYHVHKHTHTQTHTTPMQTWLFYYRSLFTDVCKGCKRLLAVAGEEKMYLPPSYRDFHLGTAYHKHCYVEIAAQ
jgi:Mediator complex subunit 27